MASHLVAALGHAWLRDQAFGIKVLAALRARADLGHVDLVDWSFGTLTAFQKLTEGDYQRAIFVSATSRAGRTPGSLARWSPTSELPADEEIHGRIGDCVMGAVSVDNLLIIARYYQVLPADVVLIEAEPVDDTWGDELSPPLSERLGTAVQMVLDELARPTAAPGTAGVSAATAVVLP